MVSIVNRDTISEIQRVHGDIRHGVVDVRLLVSSLCARQVYEDGQRFASFGGSILDGIGLHVRLYVASCRQQFLDMGIVDNMVGDVGCVGGVLGV